MVEGGNYCCQVWQLSVLVRPFFSGKRNQVKELWTLLIWTNFQTRVSEQEHLCCGSLVTVK